MNLRPELNPPDAWNENTIAHALARINRWTGHTYEPYSVAQHSVIVSYLVPREHALAGLLHDAQEFVLGDVSSPLKRIMRALGSSVYDELERAWATAIGKRFGVQLVPLPEPVHKADLFIQGVEASILVEVGDDAVTSHFGLPPSDWTEMPSRLTEMIKPWDAYWANRHWLTRFEELQAKQLSLPFNTFGVGA